MGFILGFVGALLLVAGILVGLGGNWSLAIALLSPGLALFTLAGVKTPPGWAFKQAHRMSKPVWILIGLVGLIPPLGVISFVLWTVLGRAVERQWAAGDPVSYGTFRISRTRATRGRW
jgi:hypothetical protein